MAKHAARRDLTVTVAGLFFASVCSMPSGLAAPTESKGMTSMKHPTYAEVVRNLRSASVPVHEMGTEGKVAVTPAGGRIVAMAFSADGTNLFWSHPQLGDTALVKDRPAELFGGFGGDRLWFSPEIVYNWDGVPNWNAFDNYKPPAAMDPGNYTFGKRDVNQVMLSAHGRLPVHQTDRFVGFQVERAVRLVAPPLPQNHPAMSAVDYVGIETSHHLRFDDATRTGTLDLWHLLQMPVDSVLVVPIKKGADKDRARPLSYALPGAWTQKPDHIVWRYAGEARAKFGLPADVLTGRTAVLRKLEADRWCIIVRQFPVHLDESYIDHPYKTPRHDQAFHAWDGYGFGEMEFHSSGLNAERGPRELKESDQLWAFGGSAKAIAALGQALLGVDVAYLMH